MEGKQQTGYIMWDKTHFSIEGRNKTKLMFLQFIPVEAQIPSIYTEI